MSETEINDYLSKCDEDLANNVMYRVYGMPGPIFMEENDDTPTPEPSPVYDIPFYVENITKEDETLTISSYDYSGEDPATYLKIPVEYSIDGTNWTSLGTTGETSLTKVLQSGDKVYLRATTNAWYEYQEGEQYFERGCAVSGISKVGGNIMSLLYGSSFTGNETTFPSGSNNNFGGLLTNGDNLISASELVLPATTLTNNCYAEMFNGCSSLTTAPSLPATTLADGCYLNMFSGCTSLTINNIPQLPATELTVNCYQDMFQGCTSLTTAPELPATSLADGCYLNMFYNCTSLTTAPELPATTLADDCYAGMFSGCTSLTINNIPQLPATTLAEGCYTDMFNSITMDEGEYRIWCSENIPAAANYNESIHGVLFSFSGGPQ